MKDWLIRVLGGMTRTEHLVVVETEAALHSHQGETINDLRKRLDAERVEVARLQEFIFRENNNVSDKQPTDSKREGPPTQEPIQMRRMSWLRRRSELEKRDARTADALSTEKHWRGNHEVGELTGPIDGEGHP